jgi:pimeloyl-ACP methyl ester carboxylesterase
MARDLLDELEVGFATTAEGARLAYGVLGTGPRDIFMFGSTWLSFEASIESPFSGWWWPTLIELGRVIAVDLRGAGQSDPLSPGLTGEDRVKEAIAVLDAVGASRVAVVGISAGGG